MSYETSRELLAHGLQGVYEPEPELVALEQAVDACEVPKAHRYVWQLTGDLQRRQRVIDKLQLQQARDAAAFAATDEYAFHGSASPADWLRCYRHHEMCHEGGWTLAWAEDGRLLVIPPPPDWPVPLGARAPTDAEEEAWSRRYEDDHPAIRAMVQARAAAEPPPESAPF